WQDHDAAMAASLPGLEGLRLVRTGRSVDARAVGELYVASCFVFEDQVGSAESEEDRRVGHRGSAKACRPRIPCQRRWNARIRPLDVDEENRASFEAKSRQGDE